MHKIKEIIAGKRAQRGLCSVCSAGDLVIEAALKRAKETNTVALIEATANQVNQFGGYTGMRPKDFAAKVYRIAKAVGLSEDQVVLGGDHLGPFPWRNENIETAMAKATDLVAEYVSAGFTKIHLDTSMRLNGDDPLQKMPDELIARRAASLAATAKKAQRSGEQYVYVLGSEVPIPGGTEEEEAVSVTSPQAFEEVYQCFEDVFAHHDLKSVWEDVVAFVVQPGVEFGEMNVHLYDSGAAKGLTAVLKNYPSICFEGHSTDYQPNDLLRQMVDDGIKILKVGPALTFYQREAIFALEMIEKELYSGQSAELSNFALVLEKEMSEHPEHWIHYYHGDDYNKQLMRKYSLSDRSRYYFSQENVATALNRLICNVDAVGIPYSLISQFMPVQAQKIHGKGGASDAKSLIISRICDCMDDYLKAILE